MSKEKHIIIFRANGPLKNTYLTDKLEKLNYKITSYPILIVKKIYTKEIKVNDNDVVITTSFNSIYYLSQLTQNRIFNLYTLGKAATLLAKKLGFKNIIECSGDSGNILLNFIRNNKNNLINKGNIIYAGAKEISFNLPKELSKLGYNVKRYKIYSSEAINHFSSNFINLVKKRNVSWIVLLSSKGAKAFQANAKKAFNKEELSCINFVCISSNVAKKLNKKYFKTFYPETPNINFIKKIISQCEKKYGT
ncbi:uroporphyrinogen-III synthase [Alphaproteobacteria bacterium]|nr:uroporphyrinogen-III synthase [Alphaproteobacteria bacterium]